jgi:hypothetical protein
MSGWLNKHGNHSPTTNYEPSRKTTGSTATKPTTYSATRMRNLGSAAD